MPASVTGSPPACGGWAGYEPATSPAGFRAKKNASPGSPPRSMPSWTERVEALLARERRVILGITGPPGAGKTALAESVASAFDDAVQLPMDGFHLADAQLRRLGRLDRKGAIDTFDGYGYLALLQH